MPYILSSFLMQAWLPYVCNNHSSSTTTNYTCTLTTQTFDHLNQSISIINMLYDNIPFLLDIVNCNFVRDAFIMIRHQHCHHLHDYLKCQYIGLALISDKPPIKLLRSPIYIRNNCVFLATCLIWVRLQLFHIFLSLWTLLCTAFISFMHTSFLHCRNTLLLFSCPLLLK